VADAGANDLIGGTGAAAGNLISGNAQVGVFLQGDAQVLAGNFIGTDVTGTAALGNGAAGVWVTGTGDTVGGTRAGAGNVISANAGAGVVIQAEGTRVQGNWIGTDVTGTQALGNGGNGITLSGGRSAFNTIGGTAVGAGNVISANGGDGIFVQGQVQGIIGSNVVQGNRIGTDTTGTQALDNGGNGITLSTLSGPGVRNNTIGGTAPGAGNVIAANTGSGVYLSGAITNRNVIQGNLIGLDRAGTAALANGGDGVDGVNGASANTIGGAAPAARNVIAGNAQVGIFLQGDAEVLEGNFIGTDVTGAGALGNGGAGVWVTGTGDAVGGTAAGAGNVIAANAGAGVVIEATGTRVQGNWIGTDATGTQALGNGGNGVAVVDATGNTVGGSAPRAGNTIAFNGGDGVLIDGGTGDAILHNTIIGNLGLGIDLLHGGNNDQAAPELSAAVSGGGETEFTGTLTGRPLTTYTLEFYADTVVDPSGSGQGERFLISITVTTDASGVAQFAVSLGFEVPAGEYLTATATDPDGNTSMFGLCQQVAPA
jgi:hypothetical protein